jgi:hypothetical protein
MQHPILDPLRMALQERMATQTIGTTARVCLVDQRKLLAFSQGQIPDFSAEELERLAFYLELRLATVRGSERFRAPRPEAIAGRRLGIFSPEPASVGEPAESSTL